MDENKTDIIPENAENSGTTGNAGDSSAKNDSKKSENPNKITFFEIFVLILLVLCVWLYVSPNFLIKAENRKNAQIQANASIFTSKALSEFSTNSKIKASVVSSKLIEELNAVNKNPFSKKAPAYCISGKCECVGCVKISPDDKMNSITVEAYTKGDNLLLVRTVIQPPSFVTYTRDLTSLEKQNTKRKK